MVMMLCICVCMLVCVRISGAMGRFKGAKKLTPRNFDDVMLKLRMFMCVCAYLSVFF